MKEINWRDMFMALVIRTESKQLNVTRQELERASNTDNAAVFDNGKITIMAGGLKWPEDESRIDIIGSNVNDGMVYERN